MRPVGSRLPAAFGKDTGANLVTTHALDAARARTSFVERHQSFDHQRLWADLLRRWPCPSTCSAIWLLTSSWPTGLSTRWRPDAPGAVSEVRFADSPGRLDPAYLGNLVPAAA